MRPTVALKRTRRILTLSCVSAAIWMGFLAFAACTPQNDAVAKGAACFLTTDCEPGLVCVPQSNGSRICSDDLSRVVGQAPPEGGAEDAADAEDAPVQIDAPVTEAGEDAPPPDTGIDTGVDTGADTSTD